MKKKLKFYIRKTVKNILSTEYQSVLDEMLEDARPKLNLIASYDTSKVTIWNVIENFEIHKIKFNISFNDRFRGRMKHYTFNDLVEFKKFTNEFGVSRDLDIKSFNGCQMTLNYTHPEFGFAETTEVFVNSIENKLYYIQEIQKIFDEINEFLKNKPELLI